RNSACSDEFRSNRLGQGARRSSVTSTTGLRPRSWRVGACIGAACWLIIAPAEPLQSGHVRLSLLSGLRQSPAATRDARRAADGAGVRAVPGHSLPEREAVRRSAGDL